jgi:hypothetical protein
MAASDTQKKILTPEEARTVLAANVRNIVKKIQREKTASKSDLAILAQFAEESAPASGAAIPEWVQSYAELGKIVGLHRASFPRIKRDNPDAPTARDNGGHDVKAWIKFLEGHPEIQCKSPASAEEGKDQGLGSSLALPGEKSKSQLEREKLEEQVWRIRFDNQAEAKLYLLKEDVIAWQNEAMAHVTEVLTRRLENELPPHLVGKSPEQMRVKIRAAITESCVLLKRGPAK